MQAAAQIVISEKANRLLPLSSHVRQSLEMHPKVGAWIVRARIL